MSTTPSSIATEASTALTELVTQATEALASTGPTETGSGFDSIKQMMDNFDPAALLPDLGNVAGLVGTIAGFAVVIGPVILLAMGLAYLFLSPKEANYRFGYRCYFGMGSVEAWRYTQRVAGLLWGAVGALLTVIALFTAVGYGGKEIMEVVDSAVTMLIWQVVATILSCLAINGLVMYHFDRNGGRRSHTKE